MRTNNSNMVSSSSFGFLLLHTALQFLSASGSAHGSSVNFNIDDAMPRGNILNLTIKSRITLPYGPDLYQRSPPQSPEEQPYEGYGVGMGAAESIKFDPIQRYLYSMSDAGYIIIADYDDMHQPKLTEYSFQTESKELGSFSICSEHNVLLVALTKEDRVDVYNLVNRDNPSIPTLRKSLQAGKNVKTILHSKDCNTLAISNTNSGKDLEQGSITILRNILSDDENELQTTRIPLDYGEWDDEYLLSRGLNMPLTAKSLEYWDDYSHIADELNFTEIRQNYKSSIFLEPENLAWNGPEETELLVNLQENNGLLRINMTDLSPVAVAGFGLKDHSRVPIDINDKDRICSLKLYPGLFAMRNPDTIKSIKYNDKYYVITANEGGGKEYGDWEEEFKSNKLFVGNEFRLKNVTVPKSIFDPNNFTIGHSATFNKKCENPAEGPPTCLKKVEISLGSNSIDFESDPTNPIFYRMVLFGGRGWSVYELPENPDNLLKLVFDSGDSFERQGCQHFPWAHNAKVDDEYAPITGPNNTYWKSLEDDEKTRGDIMDKNDPEEDGCLDRGDGTPGSCRLPETIDEESEKDGPAIETVIVGQACGRLVAAMAGEKNSIAMLFDITDITSPDLIQVFHLSPAIQFKNLGLAYDDGELGEIDPESGVFLEAKDSPSGKAGILWAGAQSGTVSWWEFDCKEEPSRSNSIHEAANVDVHSGTQTTMNYTNLGFSLSMFLPLLLMH